VQIFKEGNGTVKFYKGNRVLIQAQIPTIRKDLDFENDINVEVTGVVGSSTGGVVYLKDCSVVTIDEDP
jgi:hypothetical protein